MPDTLKIRFFLSPHRSEKEEPFLLSQIACDETSYLLGAVTVISNANTPRRTVMIVLPSLVKPITGQQLSKPPRILFSETGRFLQKCCLDNVSLICIISSSSTVFFIDFRPPGIISKSVEISRFSSKILRFGYTARTDFLWYTIYNNRKRVPVVSVTSSITCTCKQY